MQDQIKVITGAGYDLPTAAYYLNACIPNSATNNKTLKKK